MYCSQRDCRLFNGSGLGVEPKLKEDNSEEGPQLVVVGARFLLHGAVVVEAEDHSEQYMLTRIYMSIYWATFGRKPYSPWSSSLSPKSVVRKMRHR